MSSTASSAPLLTLPLSACFRVLPRPISTPRLRHHGTAVHVAPVAVSQFFLRTTSPSQSYKRVSILCVDVLYSCYQGTVKYFSSLTSHACGRTAEEPDRYKVVTVLRVTHV